MFKIEIEKQEELMAIKEKVNNVHSKLNIESEIGYQPTLEDGKMYVLMVIRPRGRLIKGERRHIIADDVRELSQELIKAQVFPRANALNQG